MNKYATLYLALAVGDKYQRHFLHLSLTRLHRHYYILYLHRHYIYDISTAVIININKYYFSHLHLHLEYLPLTMITNAIVKQVLKYWC